VLDSLPLAASVLACGFCLAGPTGYLWPLIPLWAAIFVMGSALLIKYDKESPYATVGWLFGAGACFIGGAIVAVALWSIFLGVWTLYVVGRAGELALKNLRGRGLPSATDDTRTDPPEEVSPTGPERRRALVFHIQTLVILAVALLIKGLLYRHGIEMPLE